MPLVSTSIITRQLKQLFSAIKCNVSDDDRPLGKIWQEVLPNLSPQALYAPFVAARSSGRQPHITIHFEKEQNPQSISAIFDASLGNGIAIKFIVRDHSIHLSDMDLRPSQQGCSHAKVLLNWVRGMAKMMGKPRLTLAAADSNGGYTWARFGFTPDADEWEAFKSELDEFRLSYDHKRIIFAEDQRIMNPYEKRYPRGFDLTADETRVIESVLHSDDPRQIWRVSDLGRVLVQADTPAQTITVGKALLCGLGWSGALALEAKDPGYERFSAYVAPSRGIQEGTDQSHDR